MVCVCVCVWMWFIIAYDQELNTNNHSVRGSFKFATFSSYIFRHVYIHRCVHITTYICSYTHLCLYTYDYMGVHVCLFILVCVYMYLLLYIYVMIHEFQYIHINTTCSCCGTSQRFEVGPSDWVLSKMGRLPKTWRIRTPSSRLCLQSRPSALSFGNYLKIAAPRTDITFSGETRSELIRHKWKFYEVIKLGNTTSLLKF